MKTLLSLGCASLVGLVVAAQPSPAQAGVGVGVGVTVPVAPVYAPAPVYPAPAPYYYGYGTPAYYGARRRVRRSGTGRRSSGGSGLWSVRTSVLLSSGSLAVSRRC